MARSLLPNTKNLAAIQYHGLPGISASCLDAVRRLVQFDEHIEEATIISAEGRHCLLLELEIDGKIAIKSGFTSGYRGEGPGAFAEALCLLDAIAVEIEEIVVSPELIDRINASALTNKDLDLLAEAERVRPVRWHEYIHSAAARRSDVATLWKSFRPVIPWSIIDYRVIDLAHAVLRDPDDALLKGFRRLEDIVRKRIDSDAHSVRLFSLAFQGNDSKLTWKDIHPGEHAGRAQLFIGTYMSYRNPRAHRELDSRQEEVIAEFLLLNHLFLMERTAIDRPPEVGEEKVPK